MLPARGSVFLLLFDFGSDSCHLDGDPEGVNSFCLERRSSRLNSSVFIGKTSRYPARDPCPGKEDF